MFINNESFWDDMKTAIHFIRKFLITIRKEPD